MKKGIVVLSLVIAMLGTFFNIPPVAKAALVKKEVFNQKFNADSFTDENSPWITFLEGWSTTDSPEYPDSPLRDGSTHVAMFNSFDLESGEIAL
ncbi:MAG: hypothetical protein LBR68_04215, partial [Lachnoclostridium sp.]|nr:hypothetical protein [Lachnoclostridium sp.]